MNPPAYRTLNEGEEKKAEGAGVEVDADSKELEEKGFGVQEKK